MVAIVSGNSLGLTSSSLDRLGQPGSLGQSVAGRAGEGVYVNSTTGNLVVQRTDELLMGVGPDAQLLRTYNSQGQFDGDNGDNWRIGFYRQVKALTGGSGLNTAGSSIVRIEADGAERLYTYDAGSGKYLNATGTGATDSLVFAAGTWTWTDGDSRTTETYDWTSGTGMLLATADIDGNTVSYSYNASNLLTRITTANSTGAQSNFTELVYDTTAGKTSNLLQVKTTAWDGAANQVTTRVRYAYDGSNRLVTVTVDLSPEDNTVADGKTYLTAYTYDGASTRVASITESNGYGVSFQYDSHGRVKQFTEGGDRTTTLTYLVSSPLANTSLGAAPALADPVYTVTAADMAAADPWATITNTVYGASDAAAVAAFKLGLGNPTLVTGQLLSPPASLSYDKAQGAQLGLLQTNVQTIATTWGPQTTLDNSAVAAYEPRLAFSPSGDGLSVWMQAPT